MPLFTILQHNLFADNYTNWERTGKRKSVLAKRELVTTSGVVVCVREDPNQWFISLFTTSSSCPFGNVVVLGQLLEFFCFTHTQCTTFAPAQKGKEASLAVQLAALTIFISQRVFVRGIWTRKGCAGGMLSILDNSLCSAALLCVELVFKIGDVGQPLGRYYGGCKGFSLPPRS